MTQVSGDGPKCESKAECWRRLSVCGRSRYPGCRCGEPRGRATADRPGSSPGGAARYTRLVKKIACIDGITIINVNATFHAHVRTRHKLHTRPTRPRRARRTHHTTNIKFDCIITPSSTHGRCSKTHRIGVARARAWPARKQFRRATVQASTFTVLLPAGHAARPRLPCHSLPAP
jgi:hypothetical protein